MLLAQIFFLITQASAAPASCQSGNYSEIQTGRDVLYQRGPDAQGLDIYIPRNAAKPYKTIVLIHGGCFQMGGKAMDDAKEQIHRLVNSGYAVVSVDYRLAHPDPEDPSKNVNTYPTSLNDVQDAWCWVQNQGASYDLDTGQMVAMGFSAGATLATYIGTAHMAGTNHQLSCKPKVAAVVDLFGRTDFLRATEPHDDPAKLDCGEAYVGQHRNEKNPQQGFRDADVLSHIDVETAAPMFITHGDNDHAVSFQNSQELCDKLSGKCELKAIHNADHMFTGPGEMDEAYSGICSYLSNNVFVASPFRMARD